MGARRLPVVAGVEGDEPHEPGEGVLHVATEHVQVGDGELGGDVVRAVRGGRAHRCGVGVAGAQHEAGRGQALLGHGVRGAVGQRRLPRRDGPGQVVGGEGLMGGPVQRRHGRGLRGRGAGVLARRGDRGHGAGDAVLTGHLEDLPHELAQRLLRHLLIDQRHRLPRHHGHDRGAGPQAQRLQHCGLLRHVQTREHEPSRLGVDRVRELPVERLARRVPGHVQVQQHRHLGGELDQLLQQTLVGVRDHPRAAAGAGVGPRRGPPGRGRGAERGQVDGAAQVGRGVGGGLGGHVGHDPSGPGPPRRRREGRCHCAPR